MSSGLPKVAIQQNFPVEQTSYMLHSLTQRAWLRAHVNSHMILQTCFASQSFGDIKVPKSKDLFRAHFLTKTGESFFKWWKTTKILLKIFCKRKMLNIWAFLGKKLNGWSHRLETLHEDNLGPVLTSSQAPSYAGRLQSETAPTYRLTHRGKV